MSYNIPQQWGMLTTYHGRAWYTNREHLPCLCLSTTFCNLRDYGMSKTKRQVNALLCKVHLHKPFVDYYGLMCRQRYNKISIKHLIGVRYLIFYWYSWFIVKRGLFRCERKENRRFLLRETHELMGSNRMSPIKYGLRDWTQEQKMRCKNVIVCANKWTEWF